MKHSISWLCALTLSLCATFSTAQAQEGETAVKKFVEEKLPNFKLEGVSKTPYLGLYEIRSGSDVLYVDEKRQYIFAGSIIDTKNFTNLTEERVNTLQAAQSKVVFTEETKQLAFKTVKGNGKRTLVVFADPNCGYCKRFEQGLQALKDVTIYTYLYPVLGEDSGVKSRSIWCSADRNKVWADWMIDGKPPTTAGTCSNPVEQVVALGRKLGINGTPTLFFTNGKRVPGAIPGEQVEELLALSVK